MSTVPNIGGGFLSNPSPFLFNFPGMASPWGHFIKPGGRVAAYVRSTGAQEGEDLYAASGSLVPSINEGLKRCRPGYNDVVYVLPGHTETYSSSGAVWANLVAGARIIGCGTPGQSNCPTITLSHAGASIALNVADVSLSGLNIRSSTAALTAAIVITGAGCSLVGNSIISTGALAANSFVQVTGAAGTTIAGNNFVVDSTAVMIAITGAASTNFLVTGNLARQAQGTTGGGFASTASTAGISGTFSHNFFKTATTSTGGVGVITIGAATITTVANVENYGGEETAAASLLVTGA